MTKRPSFALVATAALTLPSLALANEGGGLPQLDPTWYASEIFWLAVHFVILYVISAKLILPRIAEALDRREARISGDLETAGRLGEESGEVRTVYEASLTGARTEAQATRQAAIAEAQAAQLAAEKKLGEELASRALAAQERINQASAAMRTRMRDVAADAAIEIVAKIGSTTVDRSAVDAALSRLLDGQLKEVA